MKIRKILLETFPELFSSGKIQELKWELLRLDKAIEFLSGANPEDVREKFRELKQKEKEKEKERRKKVEWLSMGRDHLEHPARKEEIEEEEEREQ